MKFAIAVLALGLTLGTANAKTTSDHTKMMMTMHGGPTEAGQSAFAAIAEIVALLESDPATDWSKVNIQALQAHLADMDRVTLHTQATTEPVQGGARIVVKGEADTVASVQRMMLAHAPFLAEVTGYSVEAINSADGAQWTVKSANAGDEIKIRALGFYGLLAIGSHHQPHHLAMARGEMAH